MGRRRFRTAPASVVENRQTGDGRVFAPGSLYWDAGPQPFAWMRDGDQHIDLSEVAPQVGVVDTIERSGDEVVMGGYIDDENPDGVELIRRMEAGTASHGERQGVSVDVDDWALEVLMQGDEDGDDLTLMASLSGRGAPSALRAAAGDPAEMPGSVIVFEDAADAVVLRFTRGRIRGLTACAVQAFTDATIELEPMGATEEVPPEGEPADEAVVAAAPAAGRRRTGPPAELFNVPEPTPDARGMADVYGMPVEELIVEQPDGQLGVPLVIVERPEFGLHQVFGNVALWGTCHTGYDECVTPPDSVCAYAHFHVGEVLCDDGARVATGPLTVGTDHAAARLLAPDARDHYANTGLAFADVRASSGTFGPWVAGVARPLTDEQLAVCRASSLSGDWRRVGGNLELIGALAVNVPGFPIAREAITAAALSMVASAMRAPSLHVVDGDVVSLVAAGIVQRCPDCAARARARLVDDLPENLMPEVLARIEAKLATIELRTRPLAAGARDELVARIRGNGA